MSSFALQAFLVVLLQSTHQYALRRVSIICAAFSAVSSARIRSLRRACRHGNAAASTAAVSCPFPLRRDWHHRAGDVAITTDDRICAFMIASAHWASPRERAATISRWSLQLRRIWSGENLR